MSTENTFKDPRLLEALEYLDNKFIAEVFDDLKVPDMSDYVPGKKKPFALWKQIAALAACLILLMFTTPLFSKVADVISSFAAGVWGNDETTEEIVYDEVNLDLCQILVDYSVLTPELIEQINSTWMKLDGNDEPLFKTVDDLKYNMGTGERFLGVYNGYYIFESGYSVITAGQPQSIANMSFSRGSGVIDLYAYKDGAFYKLKELYESDEISYVDISEIHDKFYEIYDYLTITDFCRDITELSVPQMPKQLLEKNEENMIVNALVGYQRKIHGFKIENPEIYITKYYGNYNGAYVFKYKTPSIRYDCFNYYYETVEDIDFLYRYQECDLEYINMFPGSGTRIYVYFADAIYTLSEAYDNGILTYDDIKMIKNYHTSFYPYALDRFIYEEVYLFPQKLD